ncbi:MAG: beta-ketoacyl-ACP synthase II [Paludibacteraceae bacterium]|nr:beta-ketoacyl-ACP synthase II [Paludibacteraceae bacterium]
MELKRVVITGLGVISPIGNDIETVWKNAVEGNSGAGPITHFDASKFKTQFACEVKNFDALSFIDRKELRKLDTFSQFSVYAANQAINNSKLKIEEEDRNMIGVIWGSGMGGFRTFQDEMRDYFALGTPKFNPFLIPRVITNIAGAYISIIHGLHGVNFCTTSACASSAHAICEAYNYIRLGKANIILAGGAESAIEESGVGGFNAMHALSTRNDSPATASRPFSKSRDGFVLGEGAACLVLEDLEHALKRNAHIYAEIVGTGLSADAYHMVAPDPEGNGATLVMNNAISDANLKPSDIDYINTHGTSTPLGDIAEAKAIEDVFGQHAYKLSISSTKSVTGHLLGAAGAFELLVSVLAMQHSMVPPTINHEAEDIDEAINPRLDFTFNTTKQRQINYALSNSFGFGGHNASIIVRNAALI